MATILQGLAWLGVWGAWVALTRGHHPSLRVDAVATACLVAGFASATYTNQLMLIPRLWRRGHQGGYFAALLAVLTIVTVVVVGLIQFAYDRLHGPDPARYGLAFNLASDFSLIAFHVATAAAILRGVRAQAARSKAASSAASEAHAASTAGSPRA